MAKFTGMASYAALVLFLASCSWFDQSSDSNPPQGGNDRRYSKTPDEIAAAANETFGELSVQVQSDTHDSLGGRIVGERSTAGKEKITIWYKSVDARNTMVSVAVGKGDRQLAQLVQDRLATLLGAPGASGILSVGASTEGTYDQPIAQCMKAAEAALAELHMAVSRREVHDTWAEMESRQMDSVPVLIQMERTEKDQTRVRFIGGVSRNQDTVQLANRIRAEFDKKIGRQAPAK